MKTLNSITEEKIKEFNETFVCTHINNSFWTETKPNELKQFLRSSLTQVARESLEAVRLEIKEYPKEYVEFGKMPTNTKIFNDMKIIGEINGFNQAVREQNNKINKFIGEEKNYCVQCGREVEKNTPLCSDCRLEI